MAVVGTVEAKITANIADIQAKLDIVINKLNQTTTATGNLTKSVFTGVAAWDLLKKGIGMLVGFVETSIATFAKDETAVNRLQTASQKAGIQWKEMAKVMDAEVNRALKETAFASQEVVSALARLTSMGITGAKATDTLRAAEDAAAARGLDLNEVITGVVRGAAGYTRGLIQLGLNVDAVNKSTDKQAEITRQLAALYGGAAQAQTNTFAGQVKRLRNNFDEMRTTIASQVVPVINDVIKQVFGFTNEVNKNTEAQRKLQETVYRVVSGFKLLFDVASLLVTPFEAIGLALVKLPEILGAVVLDFIDNFKKIDDIAKTGFHNLTEHMKFWKDDSEKTLRKYPEISMATTKQVVNDWQGSMNKILDQSSSAMAGIMINWEAMTKGTGFEFRELGDTVTSVLDDTAEEIGDRFSEAMDKITDKVLDFNRSLRDLTSKHKEATMKIESDIVDLTEAYKKANEEREASYDESIAGILKQHEDKLKDLKDQLAEETAYGKEIDEVKIAQTKAAIVEETAFLNKHASDRVAVATEMAEDEVDKVKKTYEKERATRKTEYEKKLTDLKSELRKEEIAYKESLSDLGVSFAEQWAQMREYVARTATPEIVSAVSEMVRLANIELAKVGKPLLEAIAPVTTPTAAKVAPSPAILATIQTSVSDISAKVASLIAQAKASGLIPKAQEGGIISKTGLVLAHAGEMILPKTMSPSFNVNFYGNMSFGSEAEENRFVDKIRKVLMRDFETARLGIY